MRSFTALALGLSLVHQSTARVAHDARPDVEQRDAGNGVTGWFSRLFRKEAENSIVERQSETCYIDSFYNFVYNSSFGETFCRTYMGYPDVTVVDDFTPVSTSTYVYTTIVNTQRTTVVNRPVTTATITVGGRKRDAAPEPTAAPRDVSHLAAAEVFNAFRRQQANATASIDDPAMSASFSSACSCQPYGGASTTTTSTHSPSIVTLSGYGRSVETIATTIQGEPTTTTVTVTGTAAPAESSVEASEPPAPPASSTVSGPAPDPTAPAFSCPEDNNSTVSQMVGSERYDYIVMCDTDILDPDSFNDFTYGTFSECAAACSLGNDRLGSPACQGFTYYDAPNSGGYNCFLKPTVNVTVPAVGIDSAILLRIAVGISGGEPEGTNTEAGPFAEPTLDPSQVSSAFDAALDGSSTSISVITPGPVIVPSGLLVNGPYTAYSTYISDGTTFSSGTVFSTYVSTNGSWYYYYYTSFTQAWSSAATVYGYSEGGTAVTNTTNSESNTQSNADGSYVITTITQYRNYTGNGDLNTTTVEDYDYYAANGTLTSESATTYWTIETGAAGGGSGGGIGGSDAGVVTSTFPGSSWSTVIATSGGTAFVTSGFGSGQVVSTPAPSTSVLTVISTNGGTAYSSGFFASGVVTSGGAGGASSTEASGVVQSTGSPVPIASTLFSTGLSGESSLFLSGAVPSSGSPSPISSTVFSTGISGESSAFGSGAIPSSGAPLTPLSSTIFSTGLSGASSTGGSGAIPSSGVVPSSGASFSPISSTETFGGTGFASSTFGSGAVPSSGSPFTNSDRPRSGTLSSSSATGASGSLSVGTGSLPLGTAPTTSGPSGTAPTGTAPTGQTFSEILSVPFSNSDRPRSGTLPPSGSMPSGTAPTGTAPLGTGPSSGFPVGSGSIPGTAFTLSSATGGIASGSSGVPFSNTDRPRSGTLSPSGSGPSGTAPTGTAPIGTGPSSGFPPSGTGPIGTGPSSGFPPSGTAPIGTGPSSGFPPSGTAPIGTGPSSGLPPFSNTDRPRSGTLPPSGTAPTAPSSGFPGPSGTAPAPSTGIIPGTSPVPSSGFPPYPTAASSCVTNYLGTTTMFMTVTEFGCYSSCPPVTTTEFGCWSNCVPQGGYGGSPLTFGPPDFGGNGGRPTARPSY